jgi:hypothetical protein
VKKKHFIFIIQNNNKNRKHIKIKNKKHKSFKKKLKHEPNIVEITHLCIRHGVQTSMGLKRGAIGNTLGEHIGNLMGTHWELEGNILRTQEK